MMMFVVIKSWSYKNEKAYLLIWHLTCSFSHNIVRQCTTSHLLNAFIGYQMGILPMAYF